MTAQFDNDRTATNDLLLIVQAIIGCPISLESNTHTHTRWPSPYPVVYFLANLYVTYYAHPLS